MDSFNLYNNGNIIKMGGILMKKRYKRFYIWLIVIIFVFISVSSFISYNKFHVYNPFASGIGIIRILATDAEFAEVQHSPRVVLAKPDGKIFEKFLESEGYTQVEQLGALHIIEKDGKQEKVFCSANAYYSKFVWTAA